MKTLRRLVLPVVAVGVTASLAIAAGQTFWHVAGETSDPVPVVALQSQAPVAEPDPVETANALALAPFGSAAPVVDPDQPPEATTLDLALRGILLQSDASQSFALIATDGSTLRYSIGDDIAGKAKLAEIEDRFVVLDVKGERQILGFPNAAIDGFADTASEGTSEKVELTGLEKLRAALVAGNGSIEIKDPPPPETTEDYISMWRERIIRNPNQVLDEIGLIATEKGYTIDETHDPGVKLAGLKAGDRVARVNGQAVGNVEQDRKFFDQVAASGVARLEVVRGDRTFTLSFPLQ